MELEKFYMSLPYDLSGSMSKNRFRVELLWGVGRMLELLEQDQEFTMVFDYACDIEVHFDKKLEFFQIKSHAKGMSNYSIGKLTKKPEGEKSQGSILGKLYVLNQGNSNNVKVAVVSNVPLSVNKKIYTDAETCFDSFDEKEKDKICDLLKKELGLSEINLSAVYYICTEMDLKNPQDAILGKLIFTVKKVRGCEVDKPNALYQLIYDQVNEKACYEKDVSNYEDLVDKKGITRSNFEYMIDCHAKNSKTGFEQTKDYIDKIQNIAAKKRFKAALAKLVEAMAVSKILKSIEEEIAYSLRTAKDSDLENIDITLEFLRFRFHDNFPMEYSNEEKIVFYLVIIFRFEEGVYDEDDI
ncbi:MAG: DUF4297 domain-containing protein [Butyrivibrio sp.]|nr:DUF4297 domain-containing protein [Butyrivibrio sp.]